MRRPTGNGSAKSELLSLWRRASSSPKGGRRREGIRPVGDLPEFGYSCKEISLQVGSEGHPGVQPFRSKCGPWTAAPAFPESLSELQDHGLHPTPARSELRGIGTLTSEEHPSAGLSVHEKELIINALRRKLTRAGWKVLGPGRRTRPVIRTHP